MSIYKITNNKPEQLNLKREGFGNEFTLRDFFAENDNLYNILGIKFLAKEYQILNGRIDTIGIDENGSPVIVEYKWKENDDVLSQGLFYLDWLRNNKPHFELLVKNKLGNDTEVVWNKPRVVLIAQGFNRYIKSAVRTIQNVELKTYNLYDGDILQIENEYSPYPETIREVKQTTEEVMEDEVYNLDYHLNITSKALQDKFQEIREMLLQLPNVEEVSEQKSGITYRTTKSFTRFEFRANSIQVLVRDPKYVIDTQSLVKDVTNNKWGYLGSIKLTEDLDTAMVFEILKASYESTL
jgi:hypothetical protein